ncbi:N-acetyl-gamma-glutamyl-phosphate reductase [Fusobacterium sp. MFO224]|uniref:N-acetyl-gamma-glutamyl-phosphate reductase n=1 Tax=Fusobacterium sp. MFO224 TaxID=3378070 RepID=UPI0038543474
MLKVGIIGATGYAGQQLVWLLMNHKFVKIEFMCSNSYFGKEFSEIYPNFKYRLDSKLVPLEEATDKIKDIDVLFLALPHGKSSNLVKLAVENKTKVIDLGADFRLDDPEVFSQWYKINFNFPELIKDAVYSLPELKSKEEIQNAKIVANPGCYATASLLALAPLVKHNLIDINSIIIDAKSGVSGAGRSLKTGSLFCECNESIKAYGVGTHRHTAEIEQELSIIGKEKITTLFTPHLVPMNRGILAVSYANLKTSKSLEDVLKIYKDFYSSSYFVRVLDYLPETRFVKGSNYCDISLKIDPRTNKIIVISAIDNLIKGAAGQAVQNMNILFNFNEFEGLEYLGMNI